MGERDPGIARPGGTARHRPGDPSSGAVLEAGAQVRRDRPPERERPLVFGGGAPFQRAHDAACHGLLQRTVGGRGELRGLKGQKLEHREATPLQRRRRQDAQRVRRVEDHRVGDPDELRDHRRRVDRRVQLDEAPHLVVLPAQVRERDAVGDRGGELRIEREDAVEFRSGAGETLLEQRAEEEVELPQYEVDVRLVRRRAGGTLKVLERPLPVAPFEQLHVAGEEQAVDPLQPGRVPARAGDRLPQRRLAGVGLADHEEAAEVRGSEIGGLDDDLVVKRRRPLVVAPAECFVGFEVGRARQEAGGAGPPGPESSGATEHRPQRLLSSGRHQVGE